MPGRSFQGPLPPLTPAQAELAERLRVHVETLAGQIGERNLFRYAALQKAENYIATSFKLPSL